MGKRLELHNELISVIGCNNVYYQAPETFKMSYPCIIYTQEPGEVRRASNAIYNYAKKYSITCIINNEQDDIITHMLNKFNHCKLDNTFINDGLYHYIFTIYY